MLDADLIRSDLAEIMADLPVTCSYKSLAFTATSTDSGTSRTVEIDGALYAVDRTIVCDAADVTAGIAGDDLITVDGVDYRVLDVSRHQDGVGLEVNLKAATE